MTVVRLAAGVGPPDAFAKGLSCEKKKPALLVSYVYYEMFNKQRHRYAFRDWVLDSGAFSAHTIGKEIVLDEYIAFCKKLMEEDPTMTEVFSLDVIGNWVATAQNTEKMWEAGVPAIPCFHGGEPWEALEEMAAKYPKIALGGVAYNRSGKKLPWAEQCFARVWPKKIHGFGFGGERAILGLPFHSVDATNWELGPLKYGRWKSFGQMSVRGGQQNVRAEVEYYLKLEERAQKKWKKQMEELDALEPAPSIRLAFAGNDKVRATALGKEEQ